MVSPERGNETRSLPSKAAMRRAITAAVAALSPAERSRQDAALISRSAELPGLGAARTVLLFVAALPDEPPTGQLFAQAYQAHQRVVCPRVDRLLSCLRLFQVADPATELLAGALGIPEPRAGLPEIDPAAVDWALIPGLGFDRCGYRLGRGAGYYDRLIPMLRPDTMCWAIAYTCQVVPELLVESHDQPLDGVVTPNGVILGARGRRSTA